MLEVLQATADYENARRAMKSGGRSALEPDLLRSLRRWRLVPGLPVGEFNKSWDVARTLALIEERLPKDAPVLDLGAFCSEVPVSLAMMGYTAVHGIDLNPKVRSMPFADRVTYTVGDFNRSAYADASFDAITAISVIEHGYNPAQLLGEVGRLLRPGGLFIASFDYWPQKIDTGTTTFFGLSWLIFSQDDFQSLLQEASHHGLQALGELHPAAKERPVHCAGFDYTFAWAVLQKKP
ncbi:MAG: class I SAM-dependent methyltransferase [Ramlibacter sp.]